MNNPDLIEAYRRLGSQLHELATEAQSLCERSKHMIYPTYDYYAKDLSQAAQLANRMAAALEIFPDLEPSRDRNGRFRDLQGSSLERYVGDHGCSYEDARIALDF